MFPFTSSLIGSAADDVRVYSLRGTNMQCRRSRGTFWGEIRNMYLASSFLIGVEVLEIAFSRCEVFSICTLSGPPIYLSILPATCKSSASDPGSAWFSSKSGLTLY